QDSLFGGLDDEYAGMTIQVPQMPEWEKALKLSFERQMLGLYVSDHPLLGMEHIIGAASDCTIGELMADTFREDGSKIKIAGLITGVQRKMTRKGDTWAIVTVEDLDGAIEAMVYPSAYKLALPVLVEDSVVVVDGRIRRSDDGVELVALGVTVPKQNTDGKLQPVVVSMPISRCTHDVVEQLKQVLSTHPGMAEVHMRLIGPGSSRLMRLDQNLRVSPSSALMADLKALLGPNCLS
ncbi:MAG: DNA polymerase III subunit alpha, partial [Propionibacteriales bacterium]|nr:DNA polymerase III subunit alpha [Propionibacteriales bacterium]